MPLSKAGQAELAGYIAKKFENDPVGYCIGVLGFEPYPWQKEVLCALLTHRRVSVRSGHGVGKSRLAAAAIHWFLSTRTFPYIVATANTLIQLREKLWRELSIVHNGAKNVDLFEWTATRLALREAPERWFASAVPWSEQNPEAFAGTHAENVMLVFDESSAIPEEIWETASGAMTTAGARWLVLGNPTRNSGKFFECFGKNAAQESDPPNSGKWKNFSVSCLDCLKSPTIPWGIEQSYINEQKVEYGEGSDLYRVRVLGLPPIAESQQFISNDVFLAASMRSVVHNPYAPRIMGVDVARFGEDRTVIMERRGDEMKLLKVRMGQDTMATVGDIQDTLRRADEKGDPYRFVVVDSIGIGAGVVDRLKEQRVAVVPVNVGQSSRMPEKFRNLRAELWDAYREWLGSGSVPRELMQDSCSIQYGYDSSGKLQMEKKEDMKKRGLSSPDLSDAACLTLFPPSHISMEDLRKREHTESRPRKTIASHWNAYAK